MVCGCSIVGTIPSAIVSTIEPLGDVWSMEEVDRLFSTAFEQSISALKNCSVLLNKLKLRVSCVFTAALGRILVGWEEVAPSARMDWAGFEFASSVVWR
jgi:hypothetical protein